MENSTDEFAGSAAALSDWDRLQRAVTGTASEASDDPRVQRTWHGHLRLLLRAGVINVGVAAQALETFDQVRAMTWRLLNPQT